MARFRLGRRLPALLIAGMLAAVLSADAASAETRISLGAYTPGAPASADALADYTEMVGAKPEIVMYYRDFGLPLLYSNEVRNLRATAQTPMASWEPESARLADIAAGNYDAYLREEAAAAKEWGSELMIRFGWEMNGNWYTWGSGENEPGEFVAAWRHIVDVFRAEGADNVKWVWAPNVETGGKYPLAPYFPGDNYVDHVALDGYNWGTAPSWGRWQSLAEVFKSSYDTVTSLSTKPVMITETSSSEAGGSKADWITTGFLRAIPQLFPRVTAVIWFNKVQEDDWRIDSSSASLAAFRQVAASDLYGGTVPTDTSGPTGLEPREETAEPKPVAIRSLSIPRVIRVGGNRSARGVRRSRGIYITFNLTRAARTYIKIQRRKPGGRHITITKRVRKSRAGRTRIPLGRLVPLRRLRPGAYRVKISAFDRSGGRSRRIARFRAVAAS